MIYFSRNCCIKLIWKLFSWKCTHLHFIFILWKLLTLFQTNIRSEKGPSSFLTTQAPIIRPYLYKITEKLYARIILNAFQQKGEKFIYKGDHTKSFIFSNVSSSLSEHHQMIWSTWYQSSGAKQQGMCCVCVVKGLQCCRVVVRDFVLHIYNTISLVFTWNPAHIAGIIRFACRFCTLCVRYWILKNCIKFPLGSGRNLLQKLRFSDCILSSFFIIIGQVAYQFWRVFHEVFQVK